MKAPIKETLKITFNIAQTILSPESSSVKNRLRGLYRTTFYYQYRYSAHKKAAGGISDGSKVRSKWLLSLNTRNCLLHLVLRLCRRAVRRVLALAQAYNFEIDEV